MTATVQDFTKGAFKSYLNSALLIAKNESNHTLARTSIERFFNPLITALFDGILITDLKNIIEVCNHKKILQQNPRKISLIFIMAKTCLNVALNLIENNINESTRLVIERTYNIMDNALPIIGVISAIATMNLVFIVGYFSQLTLVYLANKDNLSEEIRSICHYTSLALCLSSIVYLNTNSLNVFQKGIKLQLANF